MSSNFYKYRIEYLKSSLSISSYVGCSLGCKYCILSSLKFNSLPEKISDEKDLVEDLCQQKFFIKNITPVSINNRTDPFLNPLIKKSTFEILKQLQNKGINQNPLFLIIKRRISKEDLLWLDNSGLNIYLFLSNSGLPKKVEPNNETFNQEFLTNLKILKNIHKVHYWRPIIEGFNDSSQDIEKILNIASSIFDCSIVSGIRLSKEVIELLRKNTGVKFEYIKDRAIHKYLADETISLIKSLRDKICGKYLLFRHTSCVVSYFSSQPDYNLAYLKQSKNCIFDCPNTASCSRSMTTVPSSLAIKNLLTKIGKINVAFSVDPDRKLFIDSNLTQEEISYLKHNLRISIVPASVINSPSEAKIVK